MQDSSSNKRDSRKSVLKLFDPCYDSPVNKYYDKVLQNSDADVNTNKNSAGCDDMSLNFNNTLNVTTPMDISEYVHEENDGEDKIEHGKGDAALNETFQRDLNINEIADVDTTLINSNNTLNVPQTNHNFNNTLNVTTAMDISYVDEENGQDKIERGKGDAALNETFQRDLNINEIADECDTTLINSNNTVNVTQTKCALKSKEDDNGKEGNIESITKVALHPRKSVLKVFDPCYDSPMKKCYDTVLENNDADVNIYKNSSGCHDMLLNINNTLNVTTAMESLESVLEENGEKDEIEHREEDAAVNETFQRDLNINEIAEECDTTLIISNNTLNLTQTKCALKSMEDDIGKDNIEYISKDDRNKTFQRATNSTESDTSLINVNDTINVVRIDNNEEDIIEHQKEVAVINETFQKDANLNENYEECDSFINVDDTTNINRQIDNNEEDNIEHQQEDSVLNETFQRDTDVNEISEELATTFININNTVNITKQTCIQQDDDQNLEDVVHNETFHTDTNLNITRNSDVTSNNVDNNQNSQVQKAISVQEQSVTDVVKTLDDVLSNVVEISNNNGRQLSDKNSELKLMLKEHNDKIASLKLQLEMKETLIEKTIVQCTKYKETLKQMQAEEEEIKQLKETVKTMKCEEEKLLERLDRLSKNETSIQKVISEYIDVISNQEAQIKIEKEKYDIAEKHLAAIKVAISDLQNKYETCKRHIDCYKANQEILQDSFADANAILRAREEKYDSLKLHVKSQIDNANQQRHSFQEKYDSDIQKLSSTAKRLEIKVSFMSTALEQKTEECNKLTALCNEVAS